MMCAWRVPIGCECALSALVSRGRRLNPSSQAACCNFTLASAMADHRTLKFKLQVSVSSASFLQLDDSILPSLQHISCTYLHMDGFLALLLSLL